MGWGSFRDRVEKNLGLNEETIKEGGLAIGYAAKIAKDFNEPETEGLSDAERQALDERKESESQRRKRLLEALRRRSRVALGVQGGARTLQYGTTTTQGTTLGSTTPLGTS